MISQQHEGTMVLTPIPATADRRHHTAPNRPYRILLAEDDREMRALLEHHLLHDGYTVESCIDGFELLQHIGSFSDNDEPKKFDLILSDIRMPGFTGLEILDFMHANGGFPPMILITAFGDERTHDEAEKLGVAAVLDKPFDLDELTAVIDRVLRADETPTVRPQVIPLPPTDDDDFPLEMIFRGYPRLPELEVRTRQAVRRLYRYRSEILFCRVVVTNNGSFDHPIGFDIRAIVTVPGRVFVVGLSRPLENVNGDFATAATELFAILDGRMRKHYERFPPITRPRSADADHDPSSGTTDY